jgi:hypothetical protein
MDLANGKPISSVRTQWGQGLVDFHRELFLLRYPKYKKDVFFDISKWFKNNGGNAKDYYKKFMALFIRNGILFENFMLDYEEMQFTKDYFLPAFFKVYEDLGLKPLIVALSPTDIEGDQFWMCHPPEILEHVDRKINRVL